VPWFDLRENDLRWKCADLIYNYLIRFDLQFEQITHWIDMNCSKFTELYMIKEYQSTTNRYFVRIKPNYVYTIWMCCVFAWRDWNCFIPVAHLPSNFNLKWRCDLWFDLIWGKWFMIWGYDLRFDLWFGIMIWFVIYPSLWSLKVLEFDFLKHCAWTKKNIRRTVQWTISVFWLEPIVEECHGAFC